MLIDSDSLCYSRELEFAFHIRLPGASFGLFPQISTTVENTVENVMLLSSCAL
jgi:hypothetical protein